MIRRDPVGVVASIAPWNYTLMMAAWKLAAAIAGGNCVVLKPSEQTPLTTLKLAALAAEVLPEGVLNVVVGRGGRGSASCRERVCEYVYIWVGAYYLKHKQEIKKNTK